MLGNLEVGEIAVGEIVTGEIAVGEIVTGEIAVGEVVTGEIAVGEVVTGEIAVGEVVLGKCHNTFIMYLLFKATNILRVQSPWTESGFFGFILKLHLLGFISPTRSNELDTMYIWMNPW